jgi:hypothetical protein
MAITLSQYLQVGANGPIGITAGGTGGTTAASARASLGAAAAGANTDITSLSSGVWAPLLKGSGSTYSAAGTNLATAAPIVSDTVVVTSSSASAYCLALPAFTDDYKSQKITVYNQTALPINVYAQGTGTITLTHTGTAPSFYTIPAMASAVFDSGISGANDNRWIVSSAQVTDPSALTAAVPANKGGTGQVSYTVGDILYASGTTTISKLIAASTGFALISNGVGVAPSWGKIDLTTTVSGTLPVANGGTGVTTSTGSGNNVLSSSPTLTTPILSAATSSTAGAIGYSTGVLTYGDGSSTISIANLTGTQTFSNKTLSTGCSWAGGLITPTYGGTGANLSGAAGGGVAYFFGGQISVTSAGTAGQVLQSNGASAPSWVTISGGATLSDDTTTNASYYPVFATATSGTMSTAKVASTKLNFNPSTGTLSSTQFNATSDSDVKTNVVAAEGIAIVNQLNGVEFDWKDGTGHSAGVIAQDVETVLPFLVQTDPIHGKSVNYLGIIAYLIQSVKELDARVKELEKLNG